MSSGAAIRSPIRRWGVCVALTSALLALCGCTAGSGESGQSKFANTPNGNALKACDAWVHTGFGNENVSASQRSSALADAATAATSAASQDAKYGALANAIREAQTQSAAEDYTPTSLAKQSALLGTVAGICRDAGQAP